MADWKAFTRRGLLGAGGVAAVAAGAAYALRGSGTSRASSADPWTLRRGNQSEPDTLDPHLATAQYEYQIVGDMFVGLMTEDAAGNPVPGAALGYDISPDGLTYRFHLRRHTWSDGVQVTADDFVYSLRRALSPKTASQSAAVLYAIKNAEEVNGGKAPLDALGVRAIDADTLEITFHIEVPYFAQLMTHNVGYPVPRHVIEKFGEQWTRPGNIVCNGPYVLKEWLPNDHVLLERNQRFYDAHNVAVRGVYYYPTEDYAAALKRFRAGELDLNIGVPSQEIGWVKSILPGALHLAPFLETQYVIFNVVPKPFNDVRLREALSLAIDREVIAGKVMRAGEQPAYAFVPPRMPSYPGTAALRFKPLPMAARIERARDLLGKAGYGQQNPLVFDYRIINETNHRLVAVALQAMWDGIGVHARIVPSDAKNHYNLLMKQDFAVASAGWVADYRDARNFLLLGQSSTKSINFGAWSSPRFDALMDQSDRTADAAARGELLDEAEQVMLDDASVAPIYFGVSRTLVSPSVKGWIDNQINVNRTRYLSLDRRVA
ncbi:MAG: peptide ABC transporter substrate-binding protein [Rhizomicrobium sp.]|jgi:oligopeptide transport system substrate-binding protein